MKHKLTLTSLIIPGLAAAGLAVTPQAASAASGSDLVTTIVAPAATRVNDVAHYDIRVTNNGNRSSGNVTVTVQLPSTGTSPTVHVKGVLSNVHPSCSRSGTVLTCTRSGIGRGSSATFGFDIALPYSTTPMAFRATAVTTNDTNTANNVASRTAAQTFYTVSVSAPATSTVNHCTGTALTSYYECQLYPSSISMHATTWLAGGSPTTGSIDFSTINGPDFADYGGSWSISGTQLTLQYTELGAPVVDFVGQGSLPGCWDGLATFANSSDYVAMYRICV